MARVATTAGDPAALAPDVRRAIASLDPSPPIYDVRPLRTYVEGARATRRVVMRLAPAFSLAALLLACVGVYGVGVMVYAVTQRRHEFGVRLALGASRGRLAAGVLRDGLTLAGLGCAIGVPRAGR